MKKSSTLLEKIKSEDITPIPKWKFVIGNNITWVFFISSILLGSIAFSVVLFSIQQTDFVLLNHLMHSKTEMILAVLPFFWLVCLLFFLGFSFYSIQYAKKAYKFTMGKIVLLSTAMSIVLGTLLFISGGAGKLEKTFASNVSLYESLEKKKTKLWSIPESGYLSGVIVEISNSKIKIKDSNGELWSINYKKSFIAPIVEIKSGERIKIIGKIESDHSFVADEIRPWGGRNRRHK